MASPTAIRLEGLILSAEELRGMTEWPDSLIEDYLTLFRSFVMLADEIDTKNNILKNTTFVNEVTYQILEDDEEIFFNTNIGEITALLPSGIDGTNYRTINVGNIGENVVLTPYGSDDLFGVNETEYIADSEVLIMTFDDVAGWY